ncbi:MAG: pentapeptide repeat-containing protein [Candidatus Eremiobacteraeota bacterium]|nr:pentapeptide repeat-containing protein [Candidatus Eremiobacteraeota bacterium]
MTRKVLAQHDQWAHGRGGQRLHLCGANLDGMRATGTRMIDARFETCSLVDAQISASILSDIEMEDCVLTRAAFSRSDMDRAILYGCRFTQADLRLARLRMADIVGSDFSSALLDRADLTDAILKESIMRGALIYDTTFDRAYVGYCDFCDADLSAQDAVHLCTAEGTWFFRCDFRGSNWEGRHLRNTRFTSCRFHGVRGKPVIDGEYAMERPNFAADNDGEDIRSGEEMFRLWGAPP